MYIQPISLNAKQSAMLDDIAQASMLPHRFDFDPAQLQSIKAALTNRGVVKLSGLPTELAQFDREHARAISDKISYAVLQALFDDMQPNHFNTTRVSRYKNGQIAFFHTHPDAYTSLYFHQNTLQIPTLFLDWQQAIDEILPHTAIITSQTDCGDKLYSNQQDREFFNQCFSAAIQAAFNFPKKNVATHVIAQKYAAANHSFLAAYQIKVLLKSAFQDMDITAVDAQDGEMIIWPDHNSGLLHSAGYLTDVPEREKESLRVFNRFYANNLRD